MKFKEGTSIRRCSEKKSALKKLAKVSEKHLHYSRFTKLQAEDLLIIKKTPVQAYSRESCLIFKNVFFQEYLWQLRLGQGNNYAEVSFK